MFKNFHDFSFNWIKWRKKTEKLDLLTFVEFLKVVWECRIGVGGDDEKIVKNKSYFGMGNLGK